MQTLRVLWVFLLTFVAAPTWAAERRVALVVGNAAYESLPALRNPHNDARGVAAKLSALGFKVILGTDLTRRGFQDALIQFAMELEGADTSLFYYAGHGVQINDVNYLVPIDAKLLRGKAFADQTIIMNRIIGLMNNLTETTVVLLDACRDNPLTSDIPLGVREAGLGRGLARVRAAGGSYIAFATAPGNVALDGAGENSPFTTALLKFIDTPNIDIRLMMADVREHVFAATDRKQLPWENNSLIGRFYFREGSGLERLDSAQRSETEAWDAIAASTRREDFAAFVRNFPDGAFAPVAKRKIEALEQMDFRANEERSDFVLARATNSERSWLGFLEHYPSGIFSELAREKLEGVQEEIRRKELTIDQLHWLSIENSKAINDFQTYLGLYPKGAHADLAKDRADALARANEITTSLLNKPLDAARDTELEREIKHRVAQVPLHFVQYGLIALGHHIGDISGVLDPATRRAIRNYQATIGAPQTGRLKPQHTVDLILSAAALGDDQALTGAGIMTASGNGLRQNEALARIWFDRASDKGNGLAMANLGILYRDGRGGARDLDQARSLLTVAVSLGVSEAEPALRGLSE